MGIYEHTEVLGDLLMRFAYHARLTADSILRRCP
jgi:hypothetical protein